MNRLKNALTRKIGPFAAWVWLTVAGGALYFYRNHTAGGGGGQSQGENANSPTYYGPYGQDAYPIQGGAGTGPGPSGDSGTGSGTNNDGGNANGGPPVINIEAPPTAPNAAGGKPRTQKPQPKHTTKKHPKPGSGKKRSNATTKNNQGRGHGKSQHGAKTRQRTTTKATTHAGGQHAAAGHGNHVPHTVHGKTPPRDYEGAPGTHPGAQKAPQPPHPSAGHPHSAAPSHPAAKAKGSTKPATRKVTRR